jgi:peptide/nickel transport system substrate-binding protein
MAQSRKSHLGWWAVNAAALMSLVLVACGTSAPIPPPATVPSNNAQPTVAAPPAATVVTSATATPFPTPATEVAPLDQAITARDEITLVIGEEPLVMSSLGTASGTSLAINYDNFADPLTWRSGDDQRIVPSTATTGWEQMAPDRWRFHLREGVKFHNGEQWNAQAALASIAIAASPDSSGPVYSEAGPFTGEVVDEFTLDVVCDAACPIFPNTSTKLNFTAPDFLSTADESDIARQNVSFGPYKLVEWAPGISVTMEAYEDYTPAGEHFEFQKGAIKEATWLFRGESNVMMAMIQTGEADIAWDVGVDAISFLDQDEIKTGGSLEVFGFEMLSMWHPETSKQKVRQAINHAVDCQEIVDTLYSGYASCQGNVIGAGVIGATERNIAPYEYNPSLAKQLLEEANYDFDTEIKMVTRGSRIPKQVEVVEAMHGYLDEVGVNVDLQVVESSVRQEYRGCRAGKAVSDLLAERGRDVKASAATLEEMQAAMALATERGGASCVTAELTSALPGYDTMDFGRIATGKMSCAPKKSPFCDPSPGGIEEKIKVALGATGAERVQLMEELSDYMHDQALWLFGFELPIFYATDSSLSWIPRNDMRVRINTMTFAE